MNNKLTRPVRIIAAISTVILAGVLVLPIWKIELSAPQYPEGLVLRIYANKLGGDVEIVNGLNHYIGMRTLHEKDFVEFSVLPYIIGTLIFFGLFAVLINRKWFFITWAGFYLLFAITAMVDFYRWEYNYGHNLDPAAPIQVPGMSYQPPLIGYKQLLNFGAYSIPDSGGWIFIGVALLLAIGAFLEIRKLRKVENVSTRKLPLAAIFFLFALISSCKQGPQPIRPGIDACDFCKMTITDNRFGGELVNDKGKVFKFDDMHCITSFLRSKDYEVGRMEIYFTDYSMTGHFVKAEESFLFKSEELHSPMGGNIAAFANGDSMNRYKKQLSGTLTSWNEIIE